MRNSFRQLLLLSTLFACGALHATTLLPGFAETDVPRPDGAATWNEAVGVAFSETGRMFVWERGGRVWIVDSANPVTQPFLNISDEVLGWRDHGMLGFALDPGFELNGYIYALYSVDPYHLFNCDSPVTGVPQCVAGYNAATTWLPNDQQSPGYRKAFIGRVVRYQATRPVGDSDYRRTTGIDYSSRRVLLGETMRSLPKNTGIPETHESHGVGSLLFGEDGTLLVSAGDGASYDSTDVGSAAETYYQNGLTDGVLQTKENVGALRAQLIDSLDGKILRIDPATGDGLASNPFYDAGAPRSARSRVWARGLRNPYRMTLHENSGSHFPADGKPGVINLGDVGWNSWEEMNVVTAPGLNFGWPLYEGMLAQGSYQSSAATVANVDAANPLFGVAGCSIQYFRFPDLLKQDTLNAPSFPNPCNSAQQIGADANPSLHSRPAIDYQHGAASTRWAAYAANGTALAQPIGTAAPNGWIVTGSAFAGNTATGGVWFDGTGFPSQYTDKYFFGDYGGQFIKTFTFDDNHNLSAVQDFASNAGGVVGFASNPRRDGLYYIAWTAFVRKVSYSPPGGAPPVAKAAATPGFGASPLTVNFSSAGTSDPDGGVLTYLWDFGDGGTSTAANPQHVYTAGTSAPTNYNATLTVSDPQAHQSSTTLLISLNNTPPTAAITSPANGSTYSLTGGPITVNLRANISDGQTPTANLTCVWQEVLYHNEHEHSDPFINSCDATAVITPIGCDGQQYAYGFRFWVYDAQGLSASQESKVYPACSATGDTTPPSVPSGLTATAQSTSQIALGWSPSTDIGTGLGGYRVLRNGVQVASVGTNSYTDVGLNPSTTYSYTVVAFDNASPPNVSAPSISVNVTTLSPTAVAIRINAAGPAFTDSLGQVWAADTGFNTGNTVNSPGAIANTLEDALYQTERWDDSAAPEMQYSIPVANGTYLVRLHFAESYISSAMPNGGIGQRVFDVDMEGIRRFEDVDVFAESGGQRVALIKSATVIVNDGQLNILFRHQVENPFINAIEVIGQSTAVDTTPPSVPAGVTATALSTTQIALSWTASTDTGGVGVGGYRVFRDGVLVGSPTSPSFTDTALTGNTTYSYTISAFDNASPANVSQTSAALNATTLSASNTVIRINAGGPAFTDSLGQVWAADNGFNTGTVATTTAAIANTIEDTLYQSERWDATAAPEMQYNINVPNGTYLVRLHFSESYINSSMPNAGIGQRVFDVDMEGVRRFEDIDIFAETGAPRAALIKSTTVTVADGQLNILFRHQVENPSINAIEVISQGTVADTTPPTVPTGLTATPQSTTQIALNWTASTDTGTGVAGYRVLRNGAQIASVGTTSYTDGPLNPNTTYSYTLIAYDNATPANASAPSGAVNATTPAVADTTPPTVPTGLTATPQSSTQIVLSWSASTDSGTGVAGYRVFRDGVQIASQATTGYTDSGRTASTTYSYTVAAFDNATPTNVSAPSGAVTATTQAAADTTPPTVPTGLVATPLSTTQISLTWNASTDAGTGVGGYRVLRDGVQVGSVTVTNYTDSGLTANTTYSYSVRAIDNANPVNVSVASTAVNATTQAVPDTTPPTVPTGVAAVALNTSQISVSWSASTDAGTGVGGYRVLRNGAQVASVAGTSYVDGSLNPATTYTYTIVAFDNANPTNASAPSAVATATTQTLVDTTPPSVPTGLTASALSASQVSLSWNASTDSGTGVAGYRVLRNGVQVGSVATVGYTDSGLNATTSYSYTVTAFDNANPANVSAPSTAASATTLSPSNTVIRINAGGPAFTDSLGQVWAADNGFNTGNVATTTAAIANTIEDSLYQSERWDDNAAPEMQYNINVPNGTYLVRLHFSESYINSSMPNGGIGQRVFDVDMEGVRRFEDIDIFSETHAPRAALIKSVTVIVNDGQLNILFRHQVENPLINAIEVIGQSTAVDTTPPTVPSGLTATALSTTQIALSWTASTDTGGVGVGGYRVLRNGVQVATSTSPSYNDSGLTANTSYTYTVTAFDNASPSNVSQPSTAVNATTLSVSNSTIIRINAGGSAPFTDSLGQVWAADNGFNTGNVATTTSAIANTIEDGLYQSERWDASAAPELQYNITVPNGTYLVRLHFSESYINSSMPNGGIGQRVFDVDMEGVRRFEDIDIFAETGAPRTALIKSTTVTVTDGQLNILFRHQVENPSINAIELISQ